MNILKITVLITLNGLLICVNAFGQQNKLYSAAFKYLKMQNKKSDLIVSDSLTYIELSPFFNELSIEWHQKPKTTIFFLDSLDRKDSKKPVAHPSFNFKSSNRYDTTKIVYFSGMQHGMLLAEVIYENKKTDRSYKNQASFNQGTQYLFMLDKKQRIRKVYKAVIAYD